MITVRELIKLLEKENSDRIVILSSDAEGNCFSPLQKDFCLAKYNDINDIDDDNKHDSIGKKALILYPI